MTVDFNPLACLLHNPGKRFPAKHHGDEVFLFTKVEVQQEGDSGLTKKDVEQFNCFFCRVFNLFCCSAFCRLEWLLLHYILAESSLEGRIVDLQIVRLRCTTISIRMKDCHEVYKR